MGKIIIKKGLLNERGIGINVPRWENYKDANACQLTHKLSAISVKTLKIGFCRDGRTDRPGRATWLSRRRHRRRGAVCRGLIPAARASGIESSASLSRLDSSSSPRSACHNADAGNSGNLGFCRCSADDKGARRWRILSHPNL